MRCRTHAGGGVLQVDAHAQRLQFRHRFKDDAGHSYLLQGEGGGHATNAAAGDQDGAERRSV